MTEGFAKCDMNNAVFLENTVCIKNEHDYLNKMHICPAAVGTIITESDPLELKHNLKTGHLKEYEFSSINIRTDLPSLDKNEMINANINEKYLYCDNCNTEYRDYCIKCTMLVHILDRNISIDIHGGTRREVPRDILEIKELCGQLSIYALKTIPEGVVFGPFIQLSKFENSWKIKGGKLVVSDEESKFAHWMVHINSTRDILKQNLYAFQCQSSLYYRTIRKIKEGQELLVYFGEEDGHGIRKDFEKDFVPPTEAYIKDIFACTFCCLGFNSGTYLCEHKTICCNGINGMCMAKDITQCLFCNVYMDNTEYLEYHINYCSEKYTRMCMISEPDDETSAAEILMRVSNKQIKRRRHRYKCLKCNYRSTYKSDLIRHTNAHFQVKAHGCHVCRKRFKNKETLKRHVTTVHDAKIRHQ